MWREDQDQGRYMHAVFNPDTERLRRLLYDDRLSYAEVAARLWPHRTGAAGRLAAMLARRFPLIDAGREIMRAYSAGTGREAGH